MTGATVVVDGSNVVGAGGGRWWRDRPGAMHRLHGRLSRYAAVAGRSVELVLDVEHPDLPEGFHDDVWVHDARRAGRNAADDRIRELVAERVADGVAVEVVTSDRALRDDVLRSGAAVVGAGTFLTRLDELGC